MALDNDSTVDAISQKNQLADPNFIVVGQQLDIPNDDNNSNKDQSQTNAINPTAYSGTNNTNYSAAVTNANNTNSTNYSTAVAGANNTIALKNTNALVALPSQQGTNTYNGNNYQSQNTGTATAQTSGAVAATGAGAGASNNTPVNASHSPQQAVAVAQQQIGTPYVWGGNQPGGFDCSGLVQYAYGLDAAHRTTYTQQTMGAHRYDVENAQAGDIYFWGSDTAPYHEALATGNGNYIQAPRPGQNVQNGNINYYRPNYFVSMNH